MIPLLRQAIVFGLFQQPQPETEIPKSQIFSDLEIKLCVARFIAARLANLRVSRRRVHGDFSANRVKVDLCSKFHVAP